MTSQHFQAPPGPAPARRAGWLWAVAAALAVIVVGGLIGLFVWGGAGEPGPGPASSTPAVASPTALPTDDTPLPEDQYPAEVDGFTLGWSVGLPVYEITRDTVAESERISVMDGLKPGISVEQGATIDGATQVLPGVYCHVVEGLKACLAESASGRHWTTYDMFETLSMEELAAWTRQFVDAVPG